jgi:hypothetical protein
MIAIIVSEIKKREIKMNKLELEIAAQDLAGTCKSMSEVVDSDEEEDELSAFLDTNEQFLCATCSWWSYSGEIQDEDGNCSDCVDD